MPIRYLITNGMYWQEWCRDISRLVINFGEENANLLLRFVTGSEEQQRLAMGVVNMILVWRNLSGPIIAYQMSFGNQTFFHEIVSWIADLYTCIIIVLPVLFIGFNEMQTAQIEDYLLFITYWFYVIERPTKYTVSFVYIDLIFRF